MELINFNYENNSIRTVDKDGECWFVAKDVCDVLGYSNSRMAVERLDEDEKGVSKVYTLGGEQEMQVINESGLYSLVFTSNKPEAKAFRRWVTHEVLPSIRKTGMYKLEKVINNLSLQVQNGFSDHKPDYICQFECEREGLGSISTFLQILREGGYEEFTTYHRLTQKAKNEGVAEEAINVNLRRTKGMGHKINCIRIKRSVFAKLRRDFVYRYGYLPGMSKTEYNTLIAEYNREVKQID